jgi:hypothetical protein
MSMYPRELGTIPGETARVARAACPKGTLAMRLRDALGELYEDEQFAALYAVEGQPAYARLSAGGRHRAAICGESHRPPSRSCRA